MARRSLSLFKALTKTTTSYSLTPIPISRSVTYMPRPGDGTPRAVTLIPGDGIGPLVTNAVEQVMQAMHAPLYFEKYEVHGDMNRIPAEVIESIKKNKVCLKGGLRTPVGGGVSSLNVSLRKELDLKTVTAVHKANIMKLADGLFLESCREVAKKYPSIKYTEIIVDNCCMQLVSKPEQFDVMVTPNLYGNLVANTAAGIAGGTGVMPGGNVGADYAVFEQGASAGNVGKEKMVERKKANPVALLLSSAMMLRHLQFPSFADRLETAVKRVISEGKCRTKDLGGDSTTQEVVDAVIAHLD
ncbi:ISOCITRATE DEHYDROGENASE [NAD] REGULATORY SUBUNIT 1 MITOCHONDRIAL-LIKE [Salix purpurea]|uniref:ISOCITRATE DEHYDROGENASE [NAD] REGULATORY SUBUNIT 1 MITOCHONDRIAL-LIKE n=1 Tax=Salix purpurea TaxID=77065 RepID=A0A9Q0W3Z5_SALPP|nr:ISOCITRATE DEHYDROGENASE [NAD] REGULATORY SUBUNIT 1 MITOCHONDRIAL-LIKE [Salix purpurea]